MVLPLLLGLGLLAGNQMVLQRRRDAREADINERYRGLLGVAPGAMGPETAGGEMGGPTGGTGLLADPNNVQRQMQYAAGVIGIPRQREQGLAMLNAAMVRAQQQEEAKRQASQWAQQFGLQQQQFQQGQANYEQTFRAGREDAAESGRRWNLGRDFQLGQDARQASQWTAEHALRVNADARAAEAARIATAAGDAGVEGMVGAPKLPAGYGWMPGAGGKLIAAPVPGTPDHVKGVQGLSSLRDTDELIGNMLDTMQGKETLTRNGRKVRIGGTGTETHGDQAARLSQMRGAIISGIAKLRDMGVLQAGEMERIEDELPDPTGWGSVLKRNKTIEAAYDELRKQFRSKQRGHLEAHPWLVPPLPPGFQAVGAGGAAPAGGTGGGGGATRPAMGAGREDEGY